MRKRSVVLPQSERKWLQIEDFEFLCFNFARDNLSFDEPIPEYETRDNSLLESALGSPQQMFGGRLLYPSLVKQGAILFYSIIKNHPFRNGNKRIAVISLLVFLSLNHKWVSINERELYFLAKNTAETKPEERVIVLNKLEKVIRSHLVNYSK